MRGPNLVGPGSTWAHPLELIPVFRRIPCSPVRNFAYTFLWSTALGVFFYATNIGITGSLPPASVLLVYVIMANIIGYAIHGLFATANLLRLGAWVERRGLFARILYFVTVPTLGVIAGFQAWLVLFHLEVQHGPRGMIVINTMPPSHGWFAEPNWVVSVAATSMVISLMIAVVFSWREGRAHAEAERARERERMERVEREAVVANLRALQAQIEPHFLFNTLANVTTLIDRDPAQAKHMLEAFIRFLRASLATTREDSATLGAEADLIASYLAVLKVRMGARLEYAVDIPPDLADYRLAPMLLQPIVENAIRHGLEPKVEGGEVRVAARRDNGAVQIDIVDSGIGFGATTRGDGVGLSNLRARLQGLYGTRASVAITDNAPAGTRVSVRLPG